MAAPPRSRSSGRKGSPLVPQGSAVCGRDIQGRRGDPHARPDDRRALPAARAARLHPRRRRTGLRRRAPPRTPERDRAQPRRTQRLRHRAGHARGASPRPRYRRAIAAAGKRGCLDSLSRAGAQYPDCTDSGGVNPRGSRSAATDATPTPPTTGPTSLPSTAARADAGVSARAGHVRQDAGQGRGSVVLARDGDQGLRSELQFGPLGALQGLPVD